MDHRGQLFASMYASRAKIMKDEVGNKRGRRNLDQVRGLSLDLH